MTSTSSQVAILVTPKMSAREQQKISPCNSLAVAVWFAKLMMAGIPTGIAYFVQNQAGTVPPQLLWAMDSAITNTLGATEYAGEEFLSYFTTPAKLTYHFYNQAKEQSLMAAFISSLKDMYYALPKLLVRAFILTCAIGVSAMNYVGLYDALIKTDREYTLFWQIINIWQTVVYVAMISADANNLAKAYFFTPAKAKTDQVITNLLTYRLNWLFGSLSFITALGMLWSFNGMIMLIAERPQLGWGKFGDFLGNWWAALFMNIVTNGIFSFLNAKSGYQLMTWDYPIKIMTVIYNTDHKCAKVKSALKNLMLAALFYAWVIGSIWTSVYYAVTGADNNKRPDEISFSNFYQYSLAPSVVIIMTILSAIEAFGMNAKPILERAEKISAGFTDYLKANRDNKPESERLLGSINGTANILHPTGKQRSETELTPRHLVTSI